MFLLETGQMSSSLYLNQTVTPSWFHSIQLGNFIETKHVSTCECPGIETDDGHLR